MTVAELTEMKVQVACTGCRGSGEVVDVIENAVIPADLSKHIHDHAYLVAGVEVVCDCRRKTTRTKRSCLGCGGRGWNIATIAVPEPGQLVRIRDRKLLLNIFGEEEQIPDEPGKVFRVDGPDDHNLEMPNGLAVQVTWDRLTKLSKIPKGAEVDLWAFDLAEVRLVKK